MIVFCCVLPASNKARDDDDDDDVILTYLRLPDSAKPTRQSNARNVAYKQKSQNFCKMSSTPDSGFYSRPICTNAARLGGVYIECYRPKMAETYVYLEIFYGGGKALQKF